jgi:hypothetical protein
MEGMLIFAKRAYKPGQAGLANPLMRFLVLPANPLALGVQAAGSETRKIFCVVHALEVEGQ